MELRWYQQEACEAAWNSLCNRPGNPLIELPTGCHERGHPILKSDGSFVSVENIAVGDSIMGPDGLPRNVIQLCRGRGMMYRVTPIKGESFVVNDDHILFLESTNRGDKFPCRKTGGKTICISVKDYLSQTQNWKHVWKLRYANPIEFNDNFRSDGDLFDVGAEIPPYILGLILGDGHLRNGISLTTADRECINELTEFAKSKGWTVSERKDNRSSAINCLVKCGRSSVHRNTMHGSSNLLRSKSRKNPIKESLSRIGVLNKVGAEKHVPKSYLISSITSRLELLAGLLDSDGHLSGGCFEFVNKSRQLACDVAFIAKSLGFHSVVKSVYKKSQLSERRLYYKVSILGDVSRIPCRLKRKQCNERLQKKNWLRTGFKIEPIGEGEFYGFTLDKDHLYLDGNFLIHHNSGKSVVCAEICRKAVVDFKGRVMVVTFRKELLTQNHAKISSLLPFGVTSGLFSAGLRKYAKEDEVIVAGIQSCYNKAHWFGRRHLVVVDECHTIPNEGEGMYRTFIKELSELNPNLRIIGMTATPYRTGEGLLYGDGMLFNHLCYSAPIQRLMDEGYLCKITSKPSSVEYDTSKLHIRNGEFIEREMASLFDDSTKIEAACKEIVAKCADRKSILVFTTSVNHAQHVADKLHEMTGEEIGVVTGETLAIERESILNRFTKGELRFCVNINILSTGYDSPRIDAVVMLRATASPGLFAQIIGRVLRIHPSKQNGLLLDFGENIKRHGPIDSPEYGKCKKKTRSKDATEEAEGPQKRCPCCNTMVPAGLRVCACGFAFPKPKLNHENEADTESKVISEPEPFEVKEVYFSRHTKRESNGKPDTLRMDYICVRDEEGNMNEVTISEWICIEHEGFAQGKAKKWWSERSQAPFPESIDEGLDLMNRGAVAMPRSLVARREGKWWRIVSVTLDEVPDESEWLAVDSANDPIWDDFDSSEIPF